ncbi:MAG: adenylate/guanylate cyclase domain-containing protein, partial [Tardiphaga sp.]
MNCSCCGFEVQSGFAFCPKCGAKQPDPCPSCGYACAPDFAYCPKCGARVDHAPKAGNQREPSSPTIPATVTTSARSPALMLVEPERAPRRTLHKVDSEANRRTITVLFADLSGFTTMSERLDPEVMQAFQNELFEELTAAVQNFGGFVDKFIGDALLALFGAPAAHEDDPERALRAALDMIKRTACL